ncbi:hypothetical protein DERP_007607 [Dermatophagoides pteronyssinus]|uniref:Uncharacterized protein n=1 Tax=Dermatophagoides pteronyssinus TaxID=6956 RepID=A0ABQ8JKT7_DERPT|nr:hypothetical protein DERP_007607 [Dermatophagoides pteronyssinus]
MNCVTLKTFDSRQKQKSDCERDIKKHRLTLILEIHMGKKIFTIFPSNIFIFMIQMFDCQYCIDKIDSN